MHFLHLTSHLSYKVYESAQLAVFCGRSLQGWPKKKHLKTSSNFLPSFQNLIQNWENVIKIRRVGGKTSNREGWSLYSFFHTGFVCPLTLRAPYKSHQFCTCFLKNCTCDRTASFVIIAWRRSFFIWERKLERDGHAWLTGRQVHERALMHGL